jgi:hypothetical protein
MLPVFTVTGPNLVEILAFSLIIFHDPLMHPLSSEFSRALDFFHIITRRCSLLLSHLTS